MIPEPRKHQIEAEEFVKSVFAQNKRYFALFAEQGTGKTKIVLDIAKYLYQRLEIDTLIVFSTNASKDQWIDEQTPLHYGEEGWKGFIWDGCGTNRSKSAFMETAEFKAGLKVFTFNFDSLVSDNTDAYIKHIIDKSKGVFVAVDESTKIKNGRRKPVRGKRGGAKRTNKLLDLFEGPKFYKTIMTGTPTPKNPFDLWSQFEFLKKDFFGMDYFFFTHRYGIQVQHSNGNRTYYDVLSEKEFSMIKSAVKKYGILTPKALEELAIRYSIKTEDIIRINRMEQYSGYKNLEELKKKISEVTYFVKKADCLDLPPKVYETLKVDMSGEQKRIYNELKQSLFSQYSGKDLSVTKKMVLYMRLQAITGGLFPFSETDIVVNEDTQEEFFETKFSYKYIENSGKIRVLLDDLEEVSDDTFIIVWARFRAEIELIHTELLKEGYTCEKYYGGSNSEVINRFKRGEFQILVATPSKGGEALNLQIATLQYYYSNSFKADERLQSEDRSHRYGQTSSVLYKDIVCKGTVDEHILNVLKRKENLIDYFRSRSLEDMLNV